MAVLQIVASTPTGAEWPWQVPLMSDPFQGPAFHISKTKDAASGERWKRYQHFLDAVVSTSFAHSLAATFGCPFAAG